MSVDAEITSQMNALVVILRKEERIVPLTGRCFNTRLGDVRPWLAIRIGGEKCIDCLSYPSEISSVWATVGELVTTGTYHHVRPFE